MWNFDVRSDDAYKGGSSTNDGDVFHQLEVEKGVLTTNWNINDMWTRLYKTLSRVNTAIAVIEKSLRDGCQHVRGAVQHAVEPRI